MLQNIAEQQQMPFQEALNALDAGIELSVVCPDGKSRIVWGYNRATGDLFVADWIGDVWINCSDGTLRAEFES